MRAIQVKVTGALSERQLRYLEFWSTRSVHSRRMVRKISDHVFELPPNALSLYLIHRLAQNIGGDCVYPYPVGFMSDLPQPPRGLRALFVKRKLRKRQLVRLLNLELRSIKPSPSVPGEDDRGDPRVDANTSVPNKRTGTGEGRLLRDRVEHALLLGRPVRRSDLVLTPSRASRQYECSTCGARINLGEVYVSQYEAEGFFQTRRPLCSSCFAQLAPDIMRILDGRGRVLLTLPNS